MLNFYWLDIFCKIVSICLVQTICSDILDCVGIAVVLFLPEFMELLLYKEDEKNIKGNIDNAVDVWQHRKN